MIQSLKNSFKSFLKIKMYKAIAVPDCVIGMTKLDRTKFSVKCIVPVTSVTSDISMNHHMKLLKAYLLKVPNFKAIRATENGHKIFLNPEEWKENHKPFSDYEWQQEEIELTYENFTVDSVLKKVLSETDNPGGAGFSIIGHIVHVNLRDNMLKYKFVIGEVILDKLRNITLVVNKTQEIHSTFRNFTYEVIAGSGSTVVQVKEHGSLFAFDFAKVYWNPRLGTEHERIVKLLQKGDLLFDVFAGVGPFAVPAGRRGCRVMANDLNPHSFEYLQKNVKLNKVADNVRSFNMDGREFLRDVVAEELRKGAKDVKNFHVTMNLPALAVTFLDVFREFKGIPELALNVHCYCFVKGECDREEFVGNEVRQNLGEGEFVLSEIQVFFVRKVAPEKDMMRASFVLKFGTSDGIEGSSPPTKRLKNVESE